MCVLACVRVCARLCASARVRAGVAYYSLSSAYCSFAAVELSPLFSLLCSCFAFPFCCPPFWVSCFLLCLLLSPLPLLVPLPSVCFPLFCFLAFCLCFSHSPLGFPCSLFSFCPPPLLLPLFLSLLPSFRSPPPVLLSRSLCLSLLPSLFCSVFSLLPSLPHSLLSLGFSSPLSPTPCFIAHTTCVGLCFAQPLLPRSGS